MDYIEKGTRGGTNYKKKEKKKKILTEIRR